MGIDGNLIHLLFTRPDVITLFVSEQNSSKFHVAFSCFQLYLFHCCKLAVCGCNKFGYFHDWGNTWVLCVGIKMCLFTGWRDNAACVVRSSCVCLPFIQIISVCRHHEFLDSVAGKNTHDMLIPGAVFYVTGQQYSGRKLIKLGSMKLTEIRSTLPFSADTWVSFYVGQRYCFQGSLLFGRGTSLTRPPGVINGEPYRDSRLIWDAITPTLMRV